jgi:hypothetical protein
MSTAAWSQTATEMARPEPILRPFTQFTLDNGLTVMMAARSCVSAAFLKRLPYRCPHRWLPRSFI